MIIFFIQVSKKKQLGDGMELDYFLTAITNQAVQTL